MAYPALPQGWQVKEEPETTVAPDEEVDRSTSLEAYENAPPPTDHAEFNREFVERANERDEAGAPRYSEEELLDYAQGRNFAIHPEQREQFSQILSARDNGGEIQPNALTAASPEVQSDYDAWVAQVAEEARKYGIDPNEDPSTWQAFKAAIRRTSDQVGESVVQAGVRAAGALGLMDNSEQAADEIAFKASARDEAGIHGTTGELTNLGAHMALDAALPFRRTNTALGTVAKRAGSGAAAGVISGGATEEGWHQVANAVLAGATAPVLGRMLEPLGQKIGARGVQGLSNIVGGALGKRIYKAGSDELTPFGAVLRARIKGSHPELTDDVIDEVMQGIRRTNLKQLPADEDVPAVVLAKDKNVPLVRGELQHGGKELIDLHAARAGEFGPATEGRALRQGIEVDKALADNVRGIGRTGQTPKAAAEDIGKRVGRADKDAWRAPVGPSSLNAEDALARVQNMVSNKDGALDTKGIRDALFPADALTPSGTASRETAEIINAVKRADPKTEGAFKTITAHKLADDLINAIDDPRLVNSEIRERVNDIIKNNREVLEAAGWTAKDIAELRSNAVLASLKANQDKTGERVGRIGSFITSLTSGVLGAGAGGKIAEEMLKGVVGDALGSLAPGMGAGLAATAGYVGARNVQRHLRQKRALSGEVTSVSNAPIGEPGGGGVEGAAIGRGVSKATAGQATPFSVSPPPEEEEETAYPALPQGWKVKGEQ